MTNGLAFIKSIIHKAIPEEKFNELTSLLEEMQSLEVIPSIDLEPPRDYFKLLKETEKDRVCGWLDGGRPGCVADVYAEEIVKFNESYLSKTTADLHISLISSKQDE